MPLVGGDGVAPAGEPGATQFDRWAADPARPSAAAPEKRVVITDDFGQRIQMGLGQLADLVADVREGVLDEVLVQAG